MVPSALLDHPWALEKTLHPGSPAHGVLLAFSQVVRNHGLRIVPFVDPAEYSGALARLNRLDNRSVAWRQFAHHCVRYEGDAGSSLATPVPEPPYLTMCWKHALGEEIETSQDWRCPQVVIPAARRELWPKEPEVEIRADNAVDSTTITRVLVVLEEYHAHPFALSDIDPWDLRRAGNVVRTGGTDHVCRLPKPVAVLELPWDRLSEGLARARSEGWKADGRYAFIPPDDWRPEVVSKDACRRGRAFPWDRKADSKGRLRGPGPMDYEGRVWEWDETHGHWDVQLGAVGPSGKDYVRVSDTGVEL